MPVRAVGALTLGGAYSRGRMDQMTTGTPRGEFTVRMFVRPMSLAEPIDEKIHRLQQLEAEGVLDALVVQAWPDEVPLSSDHTGTDVVETYQRFAAWAAREDKSIEPSFDTRTRHSMVTDESREILTMPVMCLAVYDGEALRAVYPHTDEDGHHPVAAAIDALAGG